MVLNISARILQIFGKGYLKVDDNNYILHTIMANVKILIQLDAQ